MRRTLPVLLSLAITLGACSEGDETASTIAAATTDVPAPGPSATTSESVPVGTLECENEPDPDDYIDGQIPPANRPCEIPAALQIYTVRDGVGRNAQDGDTLILDFTGIRSEDGRLFDTSYTRDVPRQFVLGRGDEVQGWDDGLVGAQAGSLVKLDIPAELAYGATPPPGSEIVEPGDALSFVIEVRAVVPAVTAADAPLDLDIEPSVGALDVTTEVLTEGDGATIELGDTAVVHLLLVRGDNEVVLFNTWERMDPLQIIMEDGQTLPGVFQGLQGARVGSLLAIAMPPAGAFGEQGEASLGLPAATDLIAIVEVVGVY